MVSIFLFTRHIYIPILTCFICCMHSAYAVASASQKNMQIPILQAKSATIDVRDGDKFLKAAWTADPIVALDVYEAQRSTLRKRITFISDIDSLSFDVHPGNTYDFVVMLNGKTPCPTRITTVPQTFSRATLSATMPAATIPIDISKGKLHIKGRINDSQELDLIFDTGADVNVIYPSALKKGVSLTFDGTMNNGGTGGKTLGKTSSTNRLTIGDLVWDRERLLLIEKQADPADGVVGYSVFNDKLVEFDYDRMVIVIHDALPAHASTFSKMAMPFRGTLTTVDVELSDGTRRATAPLLIDTGGSGSLVINPSFTRQQQLPWSMKEIGRGTLSGVGAEVLETRLLLLPELSLAGTKLANVPLVMALPGISNVAESTSAGLLCMDVLSRFNTILDYQRNMAYFKPNARHAIPILDIEKRGVNWLTLLSMLLGAGFIVFVIRRIVLSR
jgi:hypothetical protein